MARYSSDPSYQLIDQQEQVADAIATIKREEIVAVDCEGVNLCRDGTLTVLSIATKSETFLFDVMKLGAKPFDQGLSEVLEDTAVMKLVFDCRRDSDALWHLFKVKMANVMDLQLLQLMYERRHPDEKSQAQKDMERRCAVYAKQSAEAKAQHEWPRIRGLKDCMKWYLKDSALLATKERSSLSSKDADREQWGRRPLSRDLLLYATIDVTTLFQLYDKFKQGISTAEVETAQKGSARYLGFFRDQTTVAKNPYEDQSLLQMYILEDPPSDSSQRKCNACCLSFPGCAVNYEGLCKLCKVKKYKVDSAQKRQREYEERQRRRQQQRARQIRPHQNRYLDEYEYQGYGYDYY